MLEDMTWVLYEIKRVKNMYLYLGIWTDWPDTLIVPHTMYVQQPGGVL